MRRMRQAHRIRLTSDVKPAQDGLDFMQTLSAQKLFRRGRTRDVQCRKQVFHRDAKPNGLLLGRLRRDDPDHLPEIIKCWPSRIAWVDGCSELIEPVTFELDLGTHHSAAYGVWQNHVAQARATNDCDILSPFEDMRSAQLKRRLSASRCSAKPDRGESPCIAIGPRTDLELPRALKESALSSRPWVRWR